MIQRSGIIYYHDWHYSGPEKAVQPSPRPVAKHARASAGSSHAWTRLLGVGLVALALGGLIGPLTPVIRLETNYRLMQAKVAAQQVLASPGKILQGYLAMQKPNLATKPVAKPVLFTPLTAPDGALIEPVDTNFGLIIPKIGVNAKVIPAVNPSNPGEYEKALEKGVAHASTSFFPDENGTVYLFSHSTSYDWFVRDLNAVFYLVKNLDTGDTVVLIYKGKEYAYKITEKKIVSPEAVSYLVPHAGTKNLILQTCWPPGSTAERLLIFADYVEGQNQAI